MQPSSLRLLRWSDVHNAPDKPNYDSTSSRDQVVDIYWTIKMGPMLIIYILVRRRWKSSMFPQKLHSHFI